MPGKHGSWSVLFEDKNIVKKCEDFSIQNPRGYTIDDDAFWGASKFDNLHAIQFTNDGEDNDQVETTTANIAYDASTLGSFQQFVDKWDAAHLAQLQLNWDNDDVEGETAEEKITRLGARPTTYASTPIA